MWPGYRPLVGEYQKTVILVIGKSCVGKSTICNELLNKGICFLSTDSMCLRTDHGIQKIINYLSEHENDNPIDIGLLGIEISGIGEYKLFIDHLFKKYIIENPFNNIIMEGHLLTLENMKRYFLEKCQENKIRVWIMERSL